MKTTRQFVACAGLEDFLLLLVAIATGWWKFGLPPPMNADNRAYIRFRLEVLWRYGPRIQWEHTTTTFSFQEIAVEAVTGELLHGWQG